MLLLLRKGVPVDQRRSGDPTKAEKSWCNMGELAMLCRTVLPVSRNYGVKEIKQLEHWSASCKRVQRRPAPIRSPRFYGLHGHRDDGEG